MELGFVEGFVFHFSGCETENLFSVNTHRQLQLCKPTNLTGLFDSHEHDPICTGLGWVASLRSVRLWDTLSAARGEHFNRSGERVPAKMRTKMMAPLRIATLRRLTAVTSDMRRVGVLRVRGGIVQGKTWRTKHRRVVTAIKGLLEEVEESRRYPRRKVTTKSGLA